MEIHQNARFMNSRSISMRTLLCFIQYFHRLQSVNQLNVNCTCYFTCKCFEKDIFRICGLVMLLNEERTQSKVCCWLVTSFTSVLTMVDFASLLLYIDCYCYSVRKYIPANALTVELAFLVT